MRFETGLPKTGRMMTLFDAIGKRVTAQAAAEFYGLRIARGGRALCPWHDDHKPDLAFYGARCYCHACHAGGDAVALTAQLHGLSMLEAAQKINADFRLGLNLEATTRPTGPTEAQRRQVQRELDRRRWGVLCEVVREADARLQTLDGDSEKAWDDARFVKALEARSRADLALDNLWAEVIDRGRAG